MASVVYGPTVAKWMKGDVPLDTSTGLKMMLLETIATTPDNPDHEFASAIAADEWAGTNYTGGFGGAGRKALAFTGAGSQAAAVAYDSANNRVEWTFDNLTWTSLGAAANADGSVVGSAVVQEVTNDAASPVVSFHDFGDTATDGTNFILQVGSEGALHITV